VSEDKVRIPSSGLQLSGVINIPGNVPGTDKRPAFLVLHGFGSNKDSQNVLRPTTILEELGYVTLRFDMRGCGESEGEPGRVICLDQVEDTRNALSFLAEQPSVDSERIAVVGTSFGGAVAVYTAGVDKRVAAVISNGGWGNGERKFRGQHSTPEAWTKFIAILDNGPAHRARTGQSLMVPRYDIVPIPKRVRDNLAQNSVEMFPPGTITMFPAETVQSMFDFRAEDVIASIAPRPVLLLHSATDSVTPSEQSIEMFKRAGQPTELHLFSDADHFMFAENNSRVWGVIRDWLRDYFPLERKKSVSARQP
jgi:pimeloyl-ACP methyl ester carboxylesterase